MQTLDVDTVVAKVAHVLAGFDGETIEEIANKVLTEKVKYLGDSMFEYGGKEVKEVRPVKTRETPYVAMFDQIATYKPERGHGEPFVPVKVEGGQGITVTLPLSGRENADVYIERVQKEDGSFKWQINVSPDSMDIKVVVEITDIGEVSVRDEGNHWHVNAYSKE